jgi:tetratricopeptide (TPR) repeat protein
MRSGHFFSAMAVLLLVWCAGFAMRGQQSTESIASIQSLVRSRQFEQALQTADSALRTAPTDARLWALKGIILSMTGKDGEALSAFDRALVFSPDNAAALRGAVQLLYQTRDKRAIPLLQRILKSDADDSTAREMLATLEEKSGDCAAAIENFSLGAEVIRSHPQSLEAYGACLMATKQPEKAVAVFEQLYSLVPTSIPARYDFSVALVESKQYEAALKIMEPMLTAGQPEPDLLSLASEAYEGVGDTPKAVSLLRQAIVQRPTDANLYTTFAALCLSHDSFQVGIDMITAGIQYVADNPSMYISRGLLYAQLADYKNAEADFNTAEHLDARQSISSVARDLTELQQNQSDKIRQEKLLLEIRAQLKSHPDDAYLHYLLAKVITESAPDKDDEALQSALIAVKMRPDFVEARNTVASLYLRSGKYQQAVEQCRLALHYAPDDQSAMYHLIIALKHIPGPDQQEEVKALVARLSSLKQASIQQESDKKRFKLVEQQDGPAQDNR